MFALSKTLQLVLALLIWLAVAAVISYFSPGQTRNAAGGKHPLSSSTEMPFRRDRLKHAELVSFDSDNDGIPDAGELHSFTDRENFRHWFAGIAEMQFYRLSDQWNVEQRDCAGMVRFAWREALRHHDRAWFQRMGPGYQEIAPDLPASQLARGPLGEKLFRTDFGTYKDTDLAQKNFSEFADARTLKNFNCRFISRNRRLAQPGDLLFYHQPWVQKFPYHVMIFLGEPRFAADGARDWVVYHTGGSPTSQETTGGLVKKVQLSVLDHHPNKRWRPTESNPNFLGFYRLKILD